METKKINVRRSITSSNYNFKSNNDGSFENKNVTDNGLTVIFNIGPTFFHLNVINNNIQRSFNYLYDFCKKLILLSQNSIIDNSNLPLLHDKYNNKTTYSELSNKKNTVLIVNIFKERCMCEKCRSKSVLYFGSRSSALYKEILNLLSSYICIKWSKKWIDILIKQLQVIFDNINDGVTYDRLLACAIENTKTLKITEGMLDLLEYNYSYHCFHLYFKNIKKGNENEILLSTMKSLNTFQGTGKEELDIIDGICFISFESEHDLYEYTKMEENFKIKNKSPSNIIQINTILAEINIKKKNIKYKSPLKQNVENIFRKNGKSSMPCNRTSKYSKKLASSMEKTKIGKSLIHLNEESTLLQNDFSRRFIEKRNISRKDWNNRFQISSKVPREYGQSKKRQATILGENFFKEIISDLKPYRLSPSDTRNNGNKLMLKSRNTANYSPNHENHIDLTLDEGNNNTAHFIDNSSFGIIPIIHKCSRLNQICTCKNFSLGMLLNLGYLRPLSKIGVENLEALKLTEEDEDDSDYESDNNIKVNNKEILTNIYRNGRRNVLSKNKVSLRMATIAASALYRGTDKRTRIVVPIASKSILNKISDWNVKLNFDKLIETIPKYKELNTDREIHTLINDMINLVDEKEKNLLNDNFHSNNKEINFSRKINSTNEIQVQDQLLPFEFININSVQTISDSDNSEEDICRKNCTESNLLSTMILSNNFEDESDKFILPNFNENEMDKEEINYENKNKTIKINGNLMENRKEIFDVREIEKNNEVCIDLISSSDEEVEKENRRSSLVVKINKKKEKSKEKKINKETMVKNLNGNDGKESLVENRKTEKTQPIKIIDLEAEENTDRMSNLEEEEEEVVIVEKNNDEALPKDVLIDAMDDMSEIDDDLNEYAMSVVRRVDNIIANYKRKKTNVRFNNNSSYRLKSQKISQKNINRIKKMSAETRKKLSLQAPTEGDGLNSDNIVEYRLNCSLNQRNKSKSLWDILIWCDIHCIYNCDCWFTVYHLKRNSLLWIPTRKYRKSLQEVMSKIKLKTKSIKEINFYNTENHSARTYGALINYNLRNKSLIFKKKRYREISSGILTSTNSCMKIKNHYSCHNRDKEKRMLKTQFKCKLSNLHEYIFIDNSNLDSSHLENIDVWDVKQRKIPYKKIMIIPDEENDNHLSEEIISAIIVNDKNFTVYEGNDKPVSLKSSYNKIPLEIRRRSDRNFHANLKRKLDFGFVDNTEEEAVSENIKSFPSTGGKEVVAPSKKLKVKPPENQDITNDITLRNHTLRQQIQSFENKKHVHNTRSTNQSKKLKEIIAENQDASDDSRNPLLKLKRTSLEKEESSCQVASNEDAVKLKVKTVTNRDASNDLSLKMKAVSLEKERDTCQAAWNIKSRKLNLISSENLGTLHNSPLSIESKKLKLISLEEEAASHNLSSSTLSKELEEIQLRSTMENQFPLHKGNPAYDSSSSNQSKKLQEKQTDKENAAHDVTFFNESKMLNLLPLCKKDNGNNDSPSVSLSKKVKKMQIREEDGSKDSPCNSPPKMLQLLPLRKEKATYHPSLITQSKEIKGTQIRKENSASNSSFFSPPKMLTLLPLQTEGTVLKSPSVIQSMKMKEIQLRKRNAIRNSAIAFSNTSKMQNLGTFRRKDAVHNLKMIQIDHLKKMNEIRMKTENIGNDSSLNKESNLLKVVPLENLENKEQCNQHNRKTWYQLPGSSMEKSSTLPIIDLTSNEEVNLNKLRNENIPSSINLAKKIAAELKNKKVGSKYFIHVNNGLFSIKECSSAQESLSCRNILSKPNSTIRSDKFETIDLTDEPQENSDSESFLQSKQTKSLNDIIKKLDTGMDHGIIRVKDNPFKDMIYDNDNLPKLSLICSGLPELGFITVVDLKPTHIIVLDPELPELVHSFRNISFANKWLNRLLKKCVNFEISTTMFLWIVVKPGILKIKHIRPFSSEMLKNRSAYINRHHELLFLKRSCNKTETLCNKKIINIPQQNITDKEVINDNKLGPRKRIKLETAINPNVYPFGHIKKNTTSKKSIITNNSSIENSSVRLKIIRTDRKKRNFLNLNAVSSRYNNKESLVNCSSEISAISEDNNNADELSVPKILNLNNIGSSSRISNRNIKTGDTTNSAHITVHLPRIDRINR